MSIRLCFPEQNKDFAITTCGWVGPISNPLLLSKTAEQNFMKLSGIVHYMMPYCTSYFKFLFEWFVVFQSKTRTFPYKTWGSGGYHFVSIAHSFSSFCMCQPIKQATPRLSTTYILQRSSTFIFILLWGQNNGLNYTYLLSSVVYKEVSFTCTSSSCCRWDRTGWPETPACGHRGSPSPTGLC